MTADWKALLTEIVDTDEAMAVAPDGHYNSLVARMEIAMAAAKKALTEDASR